MELTVLNSGSDANGYIKQNESEAIVLECGCSLARCEEALGYNVSKVAGVLLSHEHGDHARFAAKYVQRMPLFATQGTLDALRLEKGCNANVLPIKQTMSIGNFKVMAFSTQHDATQPCGFLVKHPDFGLLLFATDTYYLRYTFAGLNYIMIECNYDKHILDENTRNGIVPMAVRERVLRSHLSVSDCIKTLKANDLSQVRAIMLLHLSGNNSNKENFVERVKRNTGKFTLVAQKGVTLPLL